MQDWKQFFAEQSNELYFQTLALNVQKARKETVVYPNPQDTFSIYAKVPISKIKVVILGQDPYHNGVATGIAFESSGDKAPPSLLNIFKEIQQDIGSIQISPRLSNWIDQGVFLLNRTLTVEENKPNSHAIFDWEMLTNNTIQCISKSNERVVFMLWGKKAQEVRPLIDESKHLVLTAAHPSPLSASRGFFGCKHFSSCNNYLKKYNIDIIDWNPIKVEGAKHDRRIEPDSTSFGY